MQDEDQTAIDIGYAVVSGPSVGRLELTTNPGVSISSFTQLDIDDGRLVYVHSGAESDDAFKFTVSDGAGGSIAATVFSISVSRVNDAPQISVPGPQSTNEDTSFSFGSTFGNAIVISDDDAFSSTVQISLCVVDGRLTLGSTSGLAIVSGANGASALKLTGSVVDLNSAINGLVYSPNRDFNGSDLLTIQIDDLGNSGSGGARSASATISISVAAVNDAPVQSLPGDQATGEDTPLVFSVAGGNSISVSDVDIDEGTGLIEFGLMATNGTLTLSSVGGLTFSMGDGAGDTDIVFTSTPANANAALNGLMFTPHADFNGTASIRVVTSDLANAGAGGELIDDDTVLIDVRAINDRPVGTQDQHTIDEDTTLTVGVASGVLANDYDVDLDSLIAVLESGPSHGTLVLNSNGSFSYTPNQHFNGSDSFTYSAFDGLAASVAITVAITVEAVNDAPLNAVPTLPSANEDTDLVFSTTNGNAIQVSDVDASPGTVGVRLTTWNGSLSLSTTSGLTFAIGTGSGDRDVVFAGSIVQVNAALNGLRFSPDRDFNSTTSLRIETRDFGNTGSNGELLDLDTISIEVIAVNDQPVAVNDRYSIDEDNTLSVSAQLGVLANDSDVDFDHLDAVLVAGPQNGTLALNADGSFEYLPSLDFNGSDSFTYRATDGRLASSLVTVTLTVNPVNDVVVPQPDVYNVDQMATLVVDTNGVLANDFDVDGDHLTATLIEAPRNGTITFNPDGTFTYQPDRSFFGVDKFTYVPHDGTVPGIATTVTLNVKQTVTSTGTGNGSGEGPPANTGDRDNDGADDFVGLAGIQSAAPVVETIEVESTDSVDAADAGDLQMADPVAGEPVAVLAMVSSEFMASGGFSDRRFEQLRELRDSSSSDGGGMQSGLSPLGNTVADAQFLWKELDALSTDLELDETRRELDVNFAVGTTAAVGTTLTVGVVAWMLRGGTFVMAMVSSLPAWTNIDPLAILDSTGMMNLDDQESLSDLVNKAKIKAAT